MNTALIIGKQLIFMFLLMAIGFILYKVKLVDDVGIKSLTNILVYLVTPATVLSSYLSSFNRESLINLGICFIMAAIVEGLFIVLSILFKLNDSVDKMCATVVNTSFMGVPLISSALGEKAVYMLTAFIAVNQVVLWVYCASILDENYKLNFKKIIKTPIIIVMFIGLFVSLCKIPVPSILTQVVSSVKSVNTPLAMLVIGAHITKLNIEEALKNFQSIYKSILLKMFIYPGIILIMLKLCSFIPETIKIITMIVASSSTAFNAVFFTHIYNKDVTKATQIVCISTILSIISIPLFTYLLLS